MNTIREKTRQLLELLDHDEEPLGVYYTDEKPDGPGPKGGQQLLSAEAEKNGTLDMRALWGGFSCVMARILLARKKKVATWLAADAYGCPGAAFYGGFYKPGLEAIAHYVSSGIPGVIEGEFFMPTPTEVRKTFTTIDPPPAPKPYCVIKPLSLFAEDEEPLVVVFFARGELLGVLASLATYSIGEPESVVMPFGAGCANVIAWPLHYRTVETPRAVLGGNDIACKSFFKIDELSFAVPIEVYRKMLDDAPNSFLKTEEWKKARKRIAESREKWD